MIQQSTYRVLGLVALSAGFSFLSCSTQGSDFPDVEGWTRAGEIMIYDADNLWEYINGAAELFVEYGVQTTRTADLASGDLTVTVDLYDMGTPLNAYGVYERERPDVSMPFPEAAAAVISPPYQALLLKGSTYVKVNVFEGELTEETGRGLLQALAASLPGQTTPPEELQLLPPNGRVSGTEGFKPEAFLGQVELTDCLFADYEGEEGQTWEGFVVLPSSAASVWESLEGEWETFEQNGLTVFFSEIPYIGLVGVTRTDRGVVGVSGADDQEQLLERLERLIS